MDESVAVAWSLAVKTTPEGRAAARPTYVGLMPKLTSPSFPPTPGRGMPRSYEDQSAQADFVAAALQARF